MARLPLALAALGAAWPSGACTRCDVDCSAPVRVEEVVAEVRSTAPGLARVRTEAGESLEVRILGGSAEDLERGTTYRFPLLYLETTTPTSLPDPLAEVPADDPAVDDPAVDAPVVDAPTVEPVAFFPDDCDCTADYISDLDGEVLDPGLDVPFRRLAIGFLGASLLGTAAWAAIRLRRGEPL